YIEGTRARNRGRITRAPGPRRNSRPAKEPTEGMEEIAFVAHRGSLGLATRNREMLRKLTSYAKIVELYYESRMDLTRGVFTSPTLRLYWPPYIAGIQFMIKGMTAKLGALRRAPDLVHAETSPMGYAAFLYSRRSGVPYVLD